MTKERVELDEYGEPNMDYVKMQEVADKTEGGESLKNGDPQNGKGQDKARPAKKRTVDPKSRNRRGPGPRVREKTEEIRKTTGKTDKGGSDGPSNKKKDKET